MGDNDDGQVADETLARHQALVAALERDQPMDWTAWALPIYDAKNLTERGRDVALWAADALRRAFGDNFITKAWDYQWTHPPARDWEHPELHPVFNQGVWPLVNSAPWALANLVQLAAQLELVRTFSRPVRESMQDYRDPVKWIHGVLQLEMAGLGLHAGWQASFEPPLGTGRFADVRLDSPSVSLLIETSSFRMSKRELQALELAEELTGRVMFGLHDIGMRHQVHISGDVLELTPEVQTAEWLREVEVAAAATAHDGEAREIAAPSTGIVCITRDMVEGQSLTVSCPNPEAPPDPWARLAYKVREKAEQAAGSYQPVWVRLEEFAGIWLGLNQAQLTLTDKLTFLTPIARQLLEPYPSLAGIIVAPAALWAGNAETHRLQETIIRRDVGVAAVRSPLPPHRARETIIVARMTGVDANLDSLVRLYEQEGSWLDWALGQLGFPSFRDLMQESTMGG